MLGTTGKPQRIHAFNRAKLFELDALSPRDTMSAMNSRSYLRTILCVVLLGFLGACASTAPSGPAALAGTWTNPLGTVWTIKPDGTFDVLVHGKHHVRGNYTIAGDTVTVVGVSGAVPKGCKGSGVYKFSRPDANTLTFTLVSDACKVRKHDVPLPWHLK
jgi:hypothetical protein